MKKVICLIFLLAILLYLIYRRTRSNYVPVICPMGMGWSLTKSNCVPCMNVWSNNMDIPNLCLDASQLCPGGMAWDYSTGACSNCVSMPVYSSNVTVLPAGIVCSGVKTCPVGKILTPAPANFCIKCPLGTNVMNGKCKSKCTGNTVLHGRTCSPCPSGSGYFNGTCMAAFPCKYGTSQNVTSNLANFSCITCPSGKKWLNGVCF